MNISDVEITTFNKNRLVALYCKRCNQEIHQWSSDALVPLVDVVQAAASASPKCGEHDQ